MMYIPVDGIEGRCFYLSEPNGNRYTFFEAKEECEKDGSMFEPKDENETSLVEKQFKQRFTADTENLGGNFWLGFVYMEYKSHYDNISLSPATWRSITTLKEVNISFSDQNEYNFAYKSYDSINDDTKSTRNYRYICELER
ncbi:uncharacterized protein LOC142355572 [Convolutriloba macropyga]|uniref:uncharacterized protein LOC142355572 n=1 Tax=Convolutriloba macropyga TaxID=536237 RepID=UPI003F51D3FD